MNLTEEVRGYVLRDIHRMGSFGTGWEERKSLIRSLLGLPLSEWTQNEVLQLGDHMSELFLAGRAGGRTQGGVSSAGTVWEALVCWYLNLGYAGTDAICVRRSWVPSPVKDALAVFHGSSQIAADVDAMVIYLPGLSKIAGTGDRRIAERQMRIAFGGRFREAKVVMVACKTNWNDAIQTPMLWNLLYAQRHRGTPFQNGFTIGRHGRALDELDQFLYSFVTVPTQGHVKLKAGSAPVRRSETMTGGAYWGWPTRNNVCRSLREFFNHQASAAGLPGAAEIGTALISEIRDHRGSVDLNSFQLP